VNNISFNPYVSPSSPAFHKISKDSKDGRIPEFAFKAQKQINTDYSSAKQGSARKSSNSTVDGTAATQTHAHAHNRGSAQQQPSPSVLKKRARKDARLKLQMLPNTQSLMHLIDNLNKGTFTDRQLSNVRTSEHCKQEREVVHKVKEKCGVYYKAFVAASESTATDTELDSMKAAFKLGMCTTDVACPAQTHYYIKCVQATKNYNHVYCRQLEEAVGLCSAGIASAFFKAANKDAFVGKDGV
jgi:hypothetical protein